MKLREAAIKCSPDKSYDGYGWKLMGYRNYRNCITIEIAKSKLSDYGYNIVYNEAYRDGYDRGIKAGTRY